HTRKIQAGDRRPTVPYAARDQELVIVDRYAGIERHGASNRIDPGGASVEARLDPVLLVKAGGSYQRLLERRLSTQILLGQWRPLVWWLRLRTDRHDVAIEAVLPQRGCRHSAGQARADDDERGRHSDLDHHGALVDPQRIRLYRLERWRRQHPAGRYVELRAMAPARHDRSVERPLFGQRALLVCARVVDGEE